MSSSRAAAKAARQSLAEGEDISYGPWHRATAS
jgi:hypothetical protein